MFDRKRPRPSLLVRRWRDKHPRNAILVGPRYVFSTWVGNRYFWIGSSSSFVVVDIIYIFPFLLLMCRLSGGWRIEVAEDCCVKSSNCAYYGCLVRMTACLLPWAVQFPSRWTDISQRIRRHGNCGGRQSNSVPARPGFIKLSNLSIAVAPNLTRTAFLFFLPPPHNNFNVAFCRQSVNSSRFQEIPFTPCRQTRVSRLAPNRVVIVHVKQLKFHTEQFIRCDAKWRRYGCNCWLVE